VIDRQLLAAIALAGTLLDLMGGLYLAYDLLDGRKGPLRIITRIATYSAIFGLGYGLPLGLRHRLVAGPGFGLALGLEFWLASARSRDSTLSVARTTAPFALLRGMVQGGAAEWTFDSRFGVWFGLFAAIALIGAYILGYSPSEEYAPHLRPRLTRRKVVATCARGLMIGAAGALAGVLTRERGTGLIFGLEIGLVVAIVGGVVATVSPFIE
jgi:hypothetical protein